MDETARTPNYEIWQRLYTDTLTDGTVREVYGLQNGGTGSVKVIISNGLPNQMIQKWGN